VELDKVGLPPSSSLCCCCCCWAGGARARGLPDDDELASVDLGGDVPRVGHERLVALRGDLAEAVVAHRDPPGDL
jgi:hypothetical protein